MRAGAAASAARRPGRAVDQTRRQWLEADQAHAELTQTAHAAEEALSRRREEAAAADSRLQTLLELKRNYEGVSEGARALLAEEDRVQGLLGMVADVLEVPAQYLDALEASLGEASAFVLAEDREALERALERLRGLTSGRATLIDLSAIAGSPLAPIPQGEGVRGRASELVRCEPRFRPLVDRLLGSVVVVEDRAVAARLSAQSEGGSRFVSLEAEVWERGRVRAGSTRSLAGLLHSEMEVRDLSGRLAEQRLTIEGQQRELEALEKRRDDEATRRAEAQAELEARREALETLLRELEGAERERQWARREAEERRLELESLEHERGAWAGEAVRARRASSGGAEAELVMDRRGSSRSAARPGHRGAGRARLATRPVPRGRRDWLRWPARSGPASSRPAWSSGATVAQAARARRDRGR